MLKKSHRGLGDENTLGAVNSVEALFSFLFLSRFCLVNWDLIVLMARSWIQFLYITSSALDFTLKL